MRHLKHLDVIRHLFVSFQRGSARGGEASLAGTVANVRVSLA